MMDSNQIKGTARDALGKVKDATGGLTGDLGLQAEGKVDQVSGKVQKQFGSTIDELGDQAKETASTVAAQAKDTAATVADRASKLADDTARTVRGAFDNAAELPRYASATVGQTVQRQPLLSLIGIGAIGYLIGYLIHAPSSPLTPEAITIRRR